MLLSIAPMIDWTNTHFRVFMRLLMPKALLYTEMLTTAAIVNNPSRTLNFDTSEMPVALQLGGSDPKALSLTAKMAEDAGFSEINLNLGCPSDRVQAGRFGACLMKEPQLVGDCLSAVKRAVKIPVSAKTRIGIDHEDSYEFFVSFVKTIVDAGTDKLIVHARKAWLKGLNPKQNRTIPPIHYEMVYRIKEEFLQTFPVIINGNINNLTAIKTHLERVDGVMLGRLACDNPYALVAIHQDLFPNESIPSRENLVAQYLNYAKKQEREGVPLSILLKPLFNFAHGLAYAKKWKAEIAEAQRKQSLTGLDLARFEVLTRE